MRSSLRKNKHLHSFTYSFYETKKYHLPVFRKIRATIEAKLGFTSLCKSWLCNFGEYLSRPTHPPSVFPNSYPLLTRQPTFSPLPFPPSDSIVRSLRFSVSRFRWLRRRRHSHIIHSFSHSFLQTPLYTVCVSLDHVFVGCAGGVIFAFNAYSLEYVTILPRPHPLGVDVAKHPQVMFDSTHYGFIIYKIIVERVSPKAAGFSGNS